MSRIPLRYCAPCGDKRLYDSEIQARDGLGRIISSRELTARDDTFGVYECIHNPKKWHIGHNSVALLLLKDGLKKLKGKRT